jgi:hypothetical protein
LAGCREAFGCLESDGLRTEFETFIFTAIFTAVEATWRDLIEAAARKPDWYLLPPGGHETMKNAAIRKDLWRDEGAGYVRKGPFPKDRTSVVVTKLARDEATGRVTYSVNAKHGDRVHYEEGCRPATVDSPIVNGGRLETTALRVSFLAVDTTGEHPTGAARSETNPITLRYESAYRNGARRVALRAAPTGTVRATLDGTNPRNGVVCSTSEVTVPDGVEFLLAIAEADGIWSEQLRVPIPASAGGGADATFKPDPHLPATWRGD